MSIIGLPIGLYGYIFPGNINLLIVDLYSSKKYRMLIVILALIIVFESLYCLLTLLLLNGLQESSIWYKLLKMFSFILILFMGFWMMAESKKNKQTQKQNILYRGIINIIIHPQQIPYWLVIGVMVNPLVEIRADKFALTVFIIFNAIGTLLAMILYMICGTSLLRYFNLNLAQINRTMGFFYIVIGSYYLLNFSIR